MARERLIKPKTKKETKPKPTNYVVKKGEYDFLIWVEGPEGKICDMACSSLIEKGNKDGVEFMERNAKLIARLLNAERK